MKTLEAIKSLISKINYKPSKKDLFIDIFSLFLLINYIANRIRSYKTNKESIILANSKPEYDNVFQIKYSNLHLNLGFYSINAILGIPCGTAFYIGNNVLLTAAHCICTEDKIDNTSDKYLDDQLKCFSFVQFNSKGKKIKTYHPQKIVIHPNYKHNPAGCDIAIVHLKEKVENLTGFSLDLDTQNFTNINAISIGFTVTMSPLNSISIPFGRFKKRAVEIPQLNIFSINSFKYPVLLNLTGYDININNNKIEFSKRMKRPLENGVRPGMSGGPLISNDNKIIGINRAFRIRPFIIKNKKYVSALQVSLETDYEMLYPNMNTLLVPANNYLSDMTLEKLKFIFTFYAVRYLMVTGILNFFNGYQNRFVPLFPHKEWILTTINILQDSEIRRYISNIVNPKQIETKSVIESKSVKELDEINRTNNPHFTNQEKAETKLNPNVHSKTISPMIFRSRNLNQATILNKYKSDVDKTKKKSLMV